MSDPGDHIGTALPDDVETQMRRDVFFTDMALSLAAGRIEMVNVFPTEEDGYWFCYTVGRSLQGQPELFISGHPHEFGGLILDWLLQNQDPLELGELDFQGGKIRIVEMDAGAAREHLTVAANFAPGDMVTWQAVITDDHGNWPEDPTFGNWIDLTRQVMRQPVFVAVDGVDDVTTYAKNQYLLHEAHLRIQQKIRPLEALAEFQRQNHVCTVTCAERYP